MCNGVMYLQVDLIISFYQVVFLKKVVQQKHDIPSMMVICDTDRRPFPTANLLLPWGIWGECHPD